MQSSSKSANQTPPIFPRLWEIDALRGIAIIQMVFYHFMWDLNYFGLFKANMLQGPWQIFARGIATQFLLILGLSLTLSYHRAGQKAEQPRLFGKYLRRSAQVFGLGMVITVATYFFIGAGYVRYGILHLLGTSVILAYPFLGRNRWLSLWAGAAAIIAGWGLKSVVVSWPWLIWLGVRQTGIYMVDYYPLLPWGGLALAGVFAGYTLYPQGRRIFSLPNWEQTRPVRTLRFLGRHSLLIYLIHQPVLMGLLITLGFGQI
jgi:uncharacterized membrane protein